MSKNYRFSPVKYHRQGHLIFTLCSSASFLASGLAKIRSPDAEGALGLETLGSAGAEDAFDTSSFGGVGAGVSLGGGAGAASDAGL